MEIIKSKDNLLVKKVVSLINSKQERVKNKLFVTEGLRICRDAVLNHAKIHTVLMTEEFKAKHLEDADFFCGACDDVRLISDAVANKLSDTVNSQGIFCICAIPETPQKIIGKKFIALENLQDPGNIGTVIRTAEAFGIDGVFLIGNCADVYSPKVLRSTMGTVFSMPLFRFSDVSAAHKVFKSLGIAVYGAILDKNAKLLSKLNFDEKSVCLIGNEANGLSNEAKNLCDNFVFIDMNGNAESLNAAVASSIIMWEMTK